VSGKRKAARVCIALLFSRTGKDQGAGRGSTGGETFLLVMVRFIGEEKYEVRKF